MKNVFVVHGPNLNLLGTREPEVYGSTTLLELENEIAAEAVALGLHCTFFQSNHEGAMIDALHEAAGLVDAVVINSGALTHYSYAIYDALVAIGKPTSTTFKRTPKLATFDAVAMNAATGVGAPW